MVLVSVLETNGTPRLVSGSPCFSKTLLRWVVSGPLVCRTLCTCRISLTCLLGPLIKVIVLPQNIFSNMKQKLNRKRNHESCRCRTLAFSLKRCYCGFSTSSTSGNKWVCPQRDFVCAPLGPRPRLMESIPNGKSFRMALCSRSALRASRNLLGN